MKIMHVLAPAHAGGLERVVHALAIGHRQAGHDVSALAVVEAWNDDHPFAGPLRREQIAVQPLVLPGRAYMREWREVGRILRRERPDVVHTHGYRTDVIAGAVARRAGIATVSTSHGFTRGSLRNRFYEHMDRRALRQFDAIAAVSRPIADELEGAGVDRQRIHVVPNAWSRLTPPVARAEAREALGLDANRVVLGWVGRMSHEKGLDIFIDALAQLKDLSFVACIVGGGPEQAAQTARAKQLGLDQHVRWTGLVPEAGRYFGAFDALVLSSRTEGVPMVVLEAMSSRIPLVVPAIGGIPDVVTPDEALLVPAERPDALAAAIRSVITDRAAADQRAAAALRKLETTFDAGPWLQRYEAVYDAARQHARRRRN